MMQLYLSGPMSGGPDYNYPLFHKAAAKIRADGHKVYNPAETACDLGVGENFDIRQAFARYCSYICNCADGIVALPGWEASKGATVEVLLAQRIGLPVFLHDGDQFLDSHQDFVRNADRDALHHSAHVSFQTTPVKAGVFSCGGGNGSKA